MSCTQFHSIKLFILRHAWLNLWDKHMTTGRINQVSLLDIEKRSKRNEPIRPSPKPDKERRAEVGPGAKEQAHTWILHTVFPHPNSNLLFWTRGKKLPSCEGLASTLGFFGFLNLRSRNHDLDENGAKLDQLRRGELMCKIAGFQNGFLWCEMRTKKTKTAVKPIFFFPLLFHRRIRTIWIPLSGKHLDFSIPSLNHIGRCKTPSQGQHCALMNTVGPTRKGNQPTTKSLEPIRDFTKHVVPLVCVKKKGAHDQKTTLLQLITFPRPHLPSIAAIRHPISPAAPRTRTCKTMDCGGSADLRWDWGRKGTGGEVDSL